MDLEKIAELVKLVEESSLTEFTYREGEVEITMSKLEYKKEAPVTTAGEVTAEEKDDTLFITSPIVGTFYCAAAPDVPAYVKVGDKVKAGETVCIVEAMKLMNEIQADFDCEIQTVMVSNEQKVEYGHPLFRVKRL